MFCSCRKPSEIEEGVEWYVEIIKRDIWIENRLKVHCKRINQLKKQILNSSRSGSTHIKIRYDKMQEVDEFN